VVRIDFRETIGKPPLQVGIASVDVMARAAPRHCAASPDGPDAERRAIVARSNSCSFMVTS